MKWILFLRPYRVVGLGLFKMNIAAARKILGIEAEKMSDEEVEETIDSTSTLVNLCIDMYLKLSPYEKKKYKVKQVSSKHSKSS